MRTPTRLNRLSIVFILAAVLSSLLSGNIGSARAAESVAPHGGEAGLGEALRVRRCLADEIHAARVAVEAVANHGDIDVDDVA